MSAHVGDFGLATFLFDTSSSNSQSPAALKGSIGYIPTGTTMSLVYISYTINTYIILIVYLTEYGSGGQASTFGDVYSYC